MLVALVVVTPLAGWAAVPALADPIALLAGAGVGISSSVIPYISDQLAMRRLARATYALMVSLLPATATVIGLVVLAQVPSWNEALGVALVIAGVALHREAARPDPSLGCAAPCSSTESEHWSQAGPPGSARRPRGSLRRAERGSPSRT
jgi:inner membrane transporter RhtA